MWAWPAQRPLCWTNGATSAEQQARFDTFRSDFNANRPHEALGQVPPIRRYEPSPRPFPDRIEEPWYDPDHAVRRVRPTGEIKWGGSAALPRRGRGEAKPSQNKPGRLSTMSPVHSVNYVSGR